MTDTQEQFKQRIRSLISAKTGGGETTTDVQRVEVEQIGEELGISPRQACEQFFALQRFVWDVADMDFSLILSDESGELPPSRNWLGINDVYIP